jgi:hypothetical protein
MSRGIVKLTKNRLTSSQEIAVGSRCGPDKLCGSSEIARQLDNALQGQRRPEAQGFIRPRDTERFQDQRT